MKLLSAPQGASKQQLDATLRERRVIELDALIQEKRKELNELDKLQLRTLSENGTKNYEEEQLWKLKIVLLTQEVDALESRHRSALVPLEEREQEVENKHRVLMEREELLVRKENDVQHTEDVLLSRLDDLSEREQTIVDSNQRLSVREFTLEAREKELQARMDSVTRVMQESIADVEATKKRLAKREATLKGREVVITEREGLVAIKEAGFENRERKIADQYHALQRAITETNLKHGTNFNRNP